MFAFRCRPSLVVTVPCPSMGSKSACPQSAHRVPAERALMRAAVLTTLFWSFPSMVCAQGVTDISPPLPLNTNAAVDVGNDFGPNIATDGAGVWIGAWTSTNTLGGTIGTDWDILFARSTDAGASWSAPQPLNQNAANDNTADFSATVVTDHAGTWLALWVSDNTLGGTTGPDRDIFVSRSTDAGMTWTTPTALNTNATVDVGDDFVPRLATDGAVWVAVWQSQDTLGGTLDDDGFDILFARSTDGGATWSAPQPLRLDIANASPLDDGFPTIVTNRGGTWVTLWSSPNPIGGTADDLDILVSRSTDGGATWSPAQLLNTDGQDDVRTDERPALATDRLGTWVAVWMAHAPDGGAAPFGSDLDIFFARSTDGGQSWSDPDALNSNAATNIANDALPQIAVAGRGAWLAAWESKDRVSFDPDQNTRSDNDILFAESTDGGGTWSASQALNLNAVTDAADDSFVQLVGDGTGTFLAAWRSVQLSPGGPLGTDMDILTARITTQPSAAVPSTSAWGLIALAVALLALARILFHRPRQVSASDRNRQA